MDRILIRNEKISVITESGTMAKDITKGVILCGDYIINSDDLVDVITKIKGDDIILGHRHSCHFDSETIWVYDYHKVLRKTMDNFEEKCRIEDSLKEKVFKLQEENKELRKRSLIKRIFGLFEKYVNK